MCLYDRVKIEASVKGMTKDSKEIEAKREVHV